MVLSEESSAANRGMVPSSYSVLRPKGELTPMPILKSPKLVMA